MKAGWKMESNSTCYCTHIDNKIALGNSLIERTWQISPLGLVSRCVFNKKANSKFENTGDAPDIQYEGLTYDKYRNNSFQEFDLIDIKQNYTDESFYSGANLEVILHFVDKLHGIELKNHITVYENAAAIRSFVEIRSENAPMGEFFNEDRINCIDQLTFSEDYGISSLEFFTRTDFTNELVAEKLVEQGYDKGSLLFLTGNDKGVFIIKESPCFTDQRKECPGNFLIKEGNIKVLGTGIRPEEICDAGFKKSYSSIVGVFCGDFDDGISSLKQFQKTAYIIDAARQNILMANPWGDRKCLEHMCEDFVMRELKACIEMGITHYQIDDGWQKGKSFKRMNKREKLEKDYWEIDSEKFPNGFDNIVKFAHENEVILTLWFAPNFNRLYKEYLEEVEILKSFYTRYEICMFKIDGVKLRDKATEERIEYMLKTLRDETNGEIYFNLDITADPRSGYFMFGQYGNLFLENRYTAWGNYFPHLTLKNLWDLSRFVPAQRLQIEFLNKQKNMDRYDNSELAPKNYSNEYLFAITMFANPLAWCEVSDLDESAKDDFKRMIVFYKKYREGIANGDIFPIGDRPGGYSFTGFQSHSVNFGYVLVFREFATESEFTFNLKFIKDMEVTFTCLTYNEIDNEASNEIDDGNENEAAKVIKAGDSGTAIKTPDYSYDDGKLTVKMPAMASYKLFKYEWH